MDGPDFVSQKDRHYFKGAFHAFDRKMQGTKDSSVTSSVWPIAFKESLETYPELQINYLDEAIEGCDACHIGGRMSKYEGILKGTPYDPETFEVRKSFGSICWFSEDSDRTPSPLVLIL